MQVSGLLGVEVVDERDHLSHLGGADARLDRIAQLGCFAVDVLSFQVSIAGGCSAATERPVMHGCSSTDLEVASLRWRQRSCRLVLSFEPFLNYF